MSADKEEIRARSDIIEVVGTYVTLKKKGKTWLGLCPFHQEKTPSFNVDPVYQSYKCFGCGASGDVFSFVEKYENMGFVEAAEFLARRAGLNFEQKGQAGGEEKRSERDRLYEVNRAARDYFRMMLEKAPVAKEYLYGRGLAHETLQKFQIGFAPDNWSGLAGYFEVKKQDLKAAEAAGLIRRGAGGDYYDVFRNRIIFPIHDEQERIVGFGGRALGDEQPKYLNTGETPIFAKSKLLYGLPFARKAVATAGKCLLMEGYTDVIAAHQAGFMNAVATLGTSLTDEHAKKLARLIPENPTVVLVYDADNAGIKATLRASEILEKEEVQVRVVRLPAGDDPDSLLKRGDSALFQRAIDTAVGRVEYLVEFAKARHDLTKEQGRIDFLRDMYRILKDLPDTVTAEAYLVRYADLHPMAAHGVPAAVAQMRVELEARRAGKKAADGKPANPERDPTASIAAHEALLNQLRAALPDERKAGHAVGVSPKKKALMDQYRRLKFQEPRVVPPAVTAPGPTHEERAESEIVRALAEPDWRPYVLNSINAELFVTPLARQFFEFILAHAEAAQADQGELARLLVQYGDESFSTAVREKLQEFHARMENVPLTKAVIDDCVRRLRQHHLRRCLKELQPLPDLASQTAVTDEDRERVRHYYRLQEELKQLEVS
jgi:DNA primase